MFRRHGLQILPRQHRIMRKTQMWVGLVTVIVAAPLLTGCTLPRRTYDPTVEPKSLDDTQFLHYLATVPTVTIDEGARAVLMLVGDTGQWPTFEERIAELRRRGVGRVSNRGILAAGRLGPDDTLDMGTLAVMLRNVVRVPRGVNDVLADATGLGERRYAVRACIDAGLLPHTRAGAPVRGGELVASLAKAEKLSIQ